MDPAGVKFGLSRNLLQLDGGGIVMAADVLDAISELARRQALTGSPEFGTDFPHLLIANGIRQVLPTRELKKDVEEELQSFCNVRGRSRRNGAWHRPGFINDSVERKLSKGRSLVVDPPSGRVPIMPWAEEKRNYRLGPSTNITFGNA